MLSNKSHSTVKITGITIVGANPSDFTETNTCAPSVASGANCFIKVKFKPSATGAQAAAVSISDNEAAHKRSAWLVTERRLLT